MEVHHEVALATYPGPLPTLSFSWSLVMMFSSPNCDHKQTPHIAHHLISFPPPPGLQPQANSQILRHLSLSLSHQTLTLTQSPKTPATPQTTTSKRLNHNFFSATPL